MEQLLGDEYQEYERCFEEKHRGGLRVNSLKLTPDEFEKMSPYELRRVPFIPNGFYYNEKEQPARHPYYFGGLYYLQEPSAMTPASLLPVKPGDKVLIAEACTHHQLKGDIARDKLPNWLRGRVGDVIIDNYSGKDFPSNLNEYKLVIHCGACMFNKAEVLSRINICRENEVPITNFGIAIAELNGILDRVIEPLI